jgi:hypothetical protein
VKGMNDREYFEERRKTFGIVFKKEPPKAVTQAFEVSQKVSLFIICRIVDLPCLKEITGGISCKSSTALSGGHL